jgi:hypothetical protein
MGVVVSTASAREGEVDGGRDEANVCVGVGVER